MTTSYYSTDKEAQIVKIITAPNFPFKRFIRIADAIFRRISRRQNATNNNLKQK